MAGGVRGPAATRQAALRPAPTSATTRSWRSSRTSWASRRSSGWTTRPRPRASPPRSISTHGTVPAYVHLGDVQFYQGRAPRRPQTWEQLRRGRPGPRVSRVRPARVASTTGAPGRPRFPRLCRHLIAHNPQDWRARLALARHLAAHGDPAGAHRRCSSRPSPTTRTRVTIHQAIWRTLRQLDLDPSLVDRYVELAADAVFYLDAHVCIRCRYRSTELLWQCPHCHEWNTFVEDRIAPAKDAEEAET